MRKECILLAAALLPPVFSQPRPAPAFEVTSVKPMAAGDRFGFEFGCSPNGRFVSTRPLRQTLLWAYNMKPYQIAGIPDWDPVVLRDAKGLYRIEARSSGPVTEDVCKLMAQTLLADRFKMASHRESRETSVYALVIGKKGPKMKLASESDSTGNKIVVNGNPMGTPVGTPKDFKPPGWSMDTLADFLSIARLGRPVVNRTGLDGPYTINLNFSTFNPNPDYVPPPGAGPDAKAALEEQMGLTLESTKAPIDMLIIDHMEKPDAN